MSQQEGLCLKIIETPAHVPKRNLEHWEDDLRMQGYLTGATGRAGSQAGEHSWPEQPPGDMIQSPGFSPLDKGAAPSLSPLAVPSSPHSVISSCSVLSFHYSGSRGQQRLPGTSDFQIPRRQTPLLAHLESGDHAYLIHLEIQHLHQGEGAVSATEDASCPVCVGGGGGAVPEAGEMERGMTLAISWDQAEDCLFQRKGRKCELRIWVVLS